MPKKNNSTSSSAFSSWYSIIFKDPEVEIKYQEYTYKTNLQTFTLLFIYIFIAITIALVKNMYISRPLNQFQNIILGFIMFTYYLLILNYSKKNKKILDLGITLIIVLIYLLHIHVFFPKIILAFESQNAFYLGTALESIRFFLYKPKIDWRYTSAGHIIINLFNISGYLPLNSLNFFHPGYLPLDRLTKNNVFVYIFPVLMSNTVPFFSFLYERKTRLIFYENWIYQKSLESYENLINNIFPNQTIIFDETVTEVLFCNESTKKALNSKTNDDVFLKMKEFQIKRTQVDQDEKSETLNNFYDLFQNLDQEGFKFYNYEGKVNNLKNKKEDQNELYFDMKIGKILWKSSPAFLLIMTDISPFKLIKRLKEIDSYKNLLLATVSHDLRTPLNCLMGMIELVLEKIIDKKQRKYLKTALKSGNLLIFMINDILDYSQIINSKISLNLKFQNVFQTTKEVISLVKFQCKKKGVQLIFEINEDLKKSYIQTDHRRLQQVLLNLLSNGLKFTSKGLIKIKISIWTNMALKRYLLFQIIDSGLGIKEQNIPQLFKLFGKLEQENSDINSTGIGLGLVICKHLIELICPDDNGYIQVESEYGKGSCFSFKIPLFLFEEGDISEENIKEHKKVYYNNYKNQDLKQFDRISSISSLSSLPSFKDLLKTKIKLLVVDDDQTSLFVISQYLEAFKIDYDTSFNGKEAVIKFSDYLRYNVIVMDCNMPVMNGFEASMEIKRICEVNKLNKVPILALTANASIKDIEDCKKHGMEYYLSKPVSKKNFKMMIENILNMKLEE